MAKRKKKIPRPRPKPRKLAEESALVDVINKLGDTELIADLYEDPFMRDNPYAKLGLYGLLLDGEIKSIAEEPLPIVSEERGYTDTSGQYIISSSGLPIKYPYGEKTQKKGMVAIRTPEGSVRWRHPKDLSMVYQPDTVYINVNPDRQKEDALKIDKIKRKPLGTTSNREALKNTIIHELMHRGFSNKKFADIPKIEEQHKYIAEKEKHAYPPAIDYRSNMQREFYEPMLRDDPEAAKFIKNMIPSLQPTAKGYYIEDPGSSNKLIRIIKNFLNSLTS